MNEPKHIVSYGGGVNSTALIIHIIKNKMPLDCVVFADTGDEMPETIKYLDVMRKYLDDHSIPFHIVQRKDKQSISGRSLQRHVMPSKVFRWCTRDFKIQPIHQFYRKFKCHIYEYMGIDFGETQRMKPAREKYITKLYPLVDSKIKRDGCVRIIEDAGLPVPDKSGCYMCPFQTRKKWRMVMEKYPELYERAILMEETSKHKNRYAMNTNISLRQFREDQRCQTKLPMFEERERRKNPLVARSVWYEPSNHRRSKTTQDLKQESHQIQRHQILQTRRGNIRIHYRVCRIHRTFKILCDELRRQRFTNYV